MFEGLIEKEPLGTAEAVRGEMNAPAARQSTAAANTSRADKPESRRREIIFYPCFIVGARTPAEAGCLHPAALRADADAGIT
jgi:hypothetical protein